MTSESKMILDRRTRSLFGEDVTYILFVRNDGKATFHVTVEYCGDSETHTLGTSFFEAAKIFDTIEQGLVTPCALADVIEDLQYLSATCGK